MTKSTDAGDAAVALHRLDALTPRQRDRLLQRAEDDLAPFVEKVRPVVEAVRDRGDAALVHYAAEFDGAQIALDAIAVGEDEFDRAFAALDPEMIETLEYAADNIRRFHAAQMPGEMWMKEIRPGVLTGERVTPIESAALYVPRGKGSFPSVALMTTIPAIVAGVPDPILLTPPGPGGTVDAATLVATRLAGVEKVFRAGGAVAVAAAAFGTQTIPRCRVIEGPGSPWFVAAKRLLADRISSQVPAGPSESIVLADETTDPRTAALDLLIEAEHGEDSSAFLVTWSPDIAEAVRRAIPEFLREMGERRVSFARAVLSGESGGIVLAGSREAAYAFVNDCAPEHLQILSRDPYSHLSHIRNAGEILLGEDTPGSIANYVLGPNAVLPTSGAASVRSALGVHDFLKRSTVGHIARAAYPEMAEHTRRFARYEGFDAHANAVSSLRPDSADSQ